MTGAPSAQTIQITSKHYLALFALAAIWSSSFMVIKVTVVTVPPLTMTAVRLVIAAVLLGVVMGIKGEAMPRNPRVWAMAVLLGLFGNAIPFTLIGWGELEIPSSQASILMAVMPLATVLLAHFFSEGERATRYAMIGVIVGFGGIVILVGPSVFKGMGGDTWHQLAVSGGAISYAISAVLAKNMPPSSLLGRAVVVMICASIIMVPAAVFFDDPLGLTPSTMALWGTLYLGTLPTAFASLIYFRLIASAGAGFFAYINYLIPVMGVIWGALFLSETISTQALMALGTIFVGLFIANYRPQAKPRNA
jgi:drug/metabolite transporter (DMT)-like permease